MKIGQLKLGGSYGLCHSMLKSLPEPVLGLFNILLLLSIIITTINLFTHKNEHAALASIFGVFHVATL